ncbi:Peptidylprolyl isomerase [Bertholletia excelsa]
MDEQLGASELEEVLRAKAAHSSAVVLESIGDIPDADIKPPDNVLFVCKLNPVTEDEDLHTIFSRFGTVTSAEIIRDYKTGDSLCYAFIEFESKEACEQAYFKMDNALIDDRRIHVDFSQSVAKLWSQFRRNQTAKGKGCFKCGAPDHIAKDCPGDSSTKQQPPKYILKDDDGQRGGDENSKYEMVFDEDIARSSRREKRQRDYDVEDWTEKRKVEDQDSEDLRQREYEKSRNKQRHIDRSREHREHERNREGRTSPSSGRRRDYELREDRRDRERNTEKRVHKDDHRRDERDHRKRSSDDVSRDRSECDYRYRSAENDGGGYGKDSKSRKFSNIDDGRRDRRDDGRKDRKEERDYGKRSRETDDRDREDRDRYQGRDGRHRGDGRR